jgi:uncharacterized protein with gpF-like domain
MGERLFKRMYGEIRKEFISSIQNFTTPEQFIQAANDFRFSDELVKDNYERFYIKTAVYFAKSVQKSSSGRMELKGEDELNAQILEEVWIAKMREFVKNKIGAKITSTITTEYADIQRITKKVVEQGIADGWGMDKIARAIAKEQGEIGIWKALRIARTEVVAANNEGVKIGAELLPGKTEKVWISTFDDRSREDHMAMDGVRVGVNEFFVLPSGNKLEYPGDASGDPGDIINCRCGYEIVSIR